MQEERLEARRLIHKADKHRIRSDRLEQIADAAPDTETSEKLEELARHHSQIAEEKMEEAKSLVA